jgi:hypothetical protein
MTDTYRESWDIRSEDGSLCFASAIYSRLVGGEQDESTLQWLAQYLRANATPHHHQPPMTNQHRATPEQIDARLRQLRARVEALEAGQQPRPSDVGQSLRQPSPATIAECGGPCEQGFEHCDCGLLERLNPRPAATDSLVERVAQGIAAADDEGLTNMTWSYHARAAIREVAAWLTEGHGDSGAWCNAAADLMEEANQ